MSYVLDSCISGKLLLTVLLAQSYIYTLRQMSFSRRWTGRVERYSHKLSPRVSPQDVRNCGLMKYLPGCCQEVFCSCILTYDTV